MNIYLVQTHRFSADVLANLLILLNKRSGIAKFRAFPSVLKLGYEELSTRCIPCQKLEQKFILQKKLLQGILRVLPHMGKKDQYLHTADTFSNNSWLARNTEGYNTPNTLDLRKYTLEQLINGTLRVSFLHQSFPFQPLGVKRTYNREPDQAHDVYTVSQFLFEECKLLRKDYEIKEEDYLVLLTDGNLDSNWIYTLDPAFNNNIILNSCPLHPLDGHQLPAALAFYLMKGVLAKKAYRSFIDWYLHLHPTTKNCLMDFNAKHQQALQDIKTVGICEECQILINEETITPELYKQLQLILCDLKKEI